jgi:hypothetical protein
VIETPGVNQGASAQIIQESMIDAGKDISKDVPVVIDVVVADNKSAFVAIVVVAPNRRQYFTLMRKILPESLK